MSRMMLIAAATAAAVVAAVALPARGSEPAAPAEAETTIQRTFVSTSGSDANPCTVTAPCRNFAAAIANTTEGGEVVALTSGGYGPFTVDKSITIAGAPGAHVAVTAFSGLAIVVDAGPKAVVVLRNLYVTGLGADTGIYFHAADVLHVEGVVVGGFVGNGLFADAAGGTLIVRDSVFRTNRNESSGGTGVWVHEAEQVEIADSRADHNDLGFVLDSGARGTIDRSAATLNSVTGFRLDSGAAFALTDVVADGNAATGVSVVFDDTQLTLRNSTLSDNGEAGLRVTGGEPVARISGSTVTGNGIGLERITTGALETFGDNLVRGNVTETAGTITAVGKT